MPMNDDRCRLLAAKIATLLDKGLMADDHVDSYLASTFSNPSADLVRKVISDPSHVERDSLVDLLLFPDETFQVALEPHLHSVRFTCADEQNVSHFLRATEPVIGVYLPVLNGHIRLIPTPSELCRLISRLNITWQIPQPLCQAIGENIRKSRRSLVGVRLRNAALDLDTAGVRFLCDFLSVYPDTNAVFWEYFEFCIEFLSQKPKSSLFTALTQEKERMIDGLQQVTKFEKLLRQANMETLMLTRVRAPAESIDYFRHRIRLIDNIIMTLLGKTQTGRADDQVIEKTFPLGFPPFP